jgi:hypothetical protein
VRLLSGGTAAISASVSVERRARRDRIARAPAGDGATPSASAQQAGAREVTVSFQGARFECAADRVAAAFETGEYPLAALAEELLKPGPISVLQAKRPACRPRDA